MNAPYPWQNKQWEALRRMKRAKRLPQALMIAGPKGIGKRALVQAWAASLLCIKPLANEEACGECIACRLLKSHSHPDFLQLKPPAAEKMIPIDEVRNLIDYLNLSRNLSAYRIALIYSAENMTINAANSLLKTLEEPVEHALLILVTTSASRLPATVRSRCQILTFPEPESEMACRWIGTQLGTVNAGVVLSLASGAPLHALIYAQGEYLQLREQWLNLILTRGFDVTSLSQSMAIEHMNWALIVLSAWMRDIIRLGMGGGVRENPDYADKLGIFSKRANLQKMMLCLDRLNYLQSSLGAGINRQLQLEAILRCHLLATGT